MADSNTDTARAEAWILCQDMTRLWNSLKTPPDRTDLDKHHARIELIKSIEERLKIVGGLLNYIGREIDQDEVFGEVPKLKFTGGDV